MAMPMRAMTSRVVASLIAFGIRTPASTCDIVYMVARARVALSSPGHAVAMARVAVALASDARLR